jgi:hypothetical protein
MEAVKRCESPRALPSMGWVTAVHAIKAFNHSETGEFALMLFNPSIYSENGRYWS